MLCTGKRAKGVAGMDVDVDSADDLRSRSRAKPSGHELAEPDELRENQASRGLSDPGSSTTPKVEV